MADSTLSKISWTEFRPDRRRLGAGAVLTGIGTLTAMAGVGVLVYELARAGRSWTGSWDVPPSELAARTLHQAQAAATSATRAGRDTWQSFSEQSSA
ncbi:hypothetical protein OG746_07150 [Streptomyces sp. NBC_01016]|uniref:hypothetical protein n=1 Tax=Streptomyces sp. NBC_01016 TaxID=2903720 RepID=UPI00225BD482|nr:hypothetical protein [Streptomyces sp. NBC_01016]MCX4828499.1 hypothetical protein [Streptomyces sp. NBC_01016]